MLSDLLTDMYILVMGHLDLGSERSQYSVDITECPKCLTNHTYSLLRRIQKSIPKITLYTQVNNKTTGVWKSDQISAIW